METIYFFGFCFLVAFIIYWMVKNDDHASFNEDLDDGRFRLDKKRDQDDS